MMPRGPHSVLVIAIFLSTGCAVHGPQTWRLAGLEQAPGHVLVPPGVAAAAVSQVTFAAQAPNWRAECAPAGDAVTIRKHGKRLRIIVSRDELLKQPSGWLAD